MKQMRYPDLVTGLASFFVCLATISSFAQTGKETVPADCQLFAEKAAFPAGSPVSLVLAFSNKSENPLELVIDIVDDSFVNHVTFVKGNAFKQPKDLTVRVPEKLKPASFLAEYRIVLSKGQVKTISIPLSTRYVFSEPGDYSVVFSPHSVRLTTQGRTLNWQPQARATVTVFSVEEPEKVGADVKLVPPDKSESGFPTLVWKLNPSKGLKLPQPVQDMGNCRVVVKDATGELIQELFWRSSGARQSPDENWNEPLQWEIPLSLSSFGLAGALFPKPGLYSIEASYRNYVWQDGHQAEGLRSGEAIVNDFYLSAIGVEKIAKGSDGQPPALSEKTREFLVVKPSDLKPDKGRWIAFSKTFKLEITPELWRKMQAIEAPKK
jgi:hypothetical protein